MYRIARTMKDSDHRSYTKRFKAISSSGYFDESSKPLSEMFEFHLIETS